MVAKMIRWRPWPPPPVTKKYEVKLVLRSLEGFDSPRFAPGLPEKGPEAASPATEEAEAKPTAEEEQRLAVEIRWKGPKLALSTLRRTVRRNFTREEAVGPNGVVAWDEEFHTVCNLSGYKENVFHPWEIAFTVLNGLKQGTKGKAPAFGMASLNIAQFASAVEEKEFEIVLPLNMSASSSEPLPSLSISLTLLELQITQESTATGSIQRSLVLVPSLPQSVEPTNTEREELSAIKAGLRRVKILTEYVSSRKAKKASSEEEGSEGRCSSKSADGEYTTPFDSDSLDDFEDGESDDANEDSSARKSFSYGTLAHANFAGGSFYSNTRIGGEDEDLMYYNHSKSDVGSLPIDDSVASVSEPSVLQSSKRSILSWRKRKLSFRSPKSRGEPLLKKAYGEEGGDDIDFDRRQLSSDESIISWWRRADDDSTANRSSLSEFGDDCFAVGSWEQKEIVSRDGLMKLQTQVFFASIDQRSEQAAGESACTALVAVIADWFQSNRDEFPIKSQFNSLIGEGSLEWRNLCANGTYRDRFPDKHFDLETVLQAKIRPLSVDSEKSYIGFFHPQGMDEGKFEFLHGAMSFDSIWEEMCHARSKLPSGNAPHVYIISWNDHFFVLKVEPEAYYIIDTLGERLYEGCNQAYILKFDRNTIIRKVTNGAHSAGEKSYPVESHSSQAQQIDPKGGPVAEVLVTNPEESNKGEEEEVVCQGKESCKEYLKSFLAAIPIRELQADIKKGLMASTLLHQRLQIEFHYTHLMEPVTEALSMEGSAGLPGNLPTEATAPVLETLPMEATATIPETDPMEAVP